MRGLGCGKAIKDPRGLGPGPFSEKHLPREGGVLVQLQVGDGKTPGPCLQRPRGCFCAQGWCVSVSFQCLTQRARLLAQRRWCRCPSGTLCSCGAVAGSWVAPAG